MQQPVVDTSSDDLIFYLRVLRKWLWLIVLVAAVAGAIVFLITISRSAIYSSTSKIIIGSSTLGNPEEISQRDIAAWEQLARTYSQLFTTRPVLDSTITALNLDTDSEELIEQIAVQPISGTQLIEVVVEDEDPDRAQAINSQLFDEVLRLAPGTNLNPEQIAFVESQLEALATDINTARDEIDTINEELRADVPTERRQELEARRIQLQNTISGWENSYNQFLSQINNPNPIDMVEPATVGTENDRNTILFTAIAVAIGASVCVLGVFAVEYIDDTVRNPEDITNQLHSNLLASIARIKGEAPRDKLVALSQPRSPVAEAFRILRSNILFAAPDEAPIRSIMVTSTSPSEGKSTTSANLAVVLAQAGYRVILVDADLRRPDLHQYFNIDNRLGLTSEFIKSRDSDELSLQNTGVPGLVLLPSGPLPYNPVELIGSARMREVLENLTDLADFVVLDSPPVYTLADAPVLSTQVDGVIFVVESNRTGARTARRSINQLHSVGANVLGVVLNRVRDNVATYAEYSTSLRDFRGRG